MKWRGLSTACRSECWATISPKGMGNSSEHSKGFEGSRPKICMQTDFFTAAFGESRLSDTGLSVVQYINI